MQVREGWRHMPQGFDALLDWIQVIPATQPNARRGEKRVVYSCRDRPADSVFSDMTMFLHGFVHSQNLLPLGNWNGCVLITVFCRDVLRGCVTGGSSLRRQPYSI